MTSFLERWFAPMLAVSAHQADPVDLEWSWNTMNIPGYGNADLVVTCRLRGGKDVVLFACIVEVDTLQHAGREYDDDKERVVAALLELRRLYPKAKLSVIHFNLRDTTLQAVRTQKTHEAGRRRRQAKRLAAEEPSSTTVSDDDAALCPSEVCGDRRVEKRDVRHGRDMVAAQRWQLLRAWLLHMMVLRRDRFPRACALYLCYDEDNNARIVWPLRNGVCGCTSRAPKVDDAHAVD
jgi:hypothetical protein